MAKIYGLFGSMTGKLADTVMLVRGGMQVARKYQPIVFNPSTPAQVAVRARLKLLSQLSAIMGPYIAMPKQGAVSSRNLFTKENFGSSSYENDIAAIDLPAVVLTKSVVGLPTIVASFSNRTITASLSMTDAEVSRVVYVAFTKQVDEKLRYAASAVVSAPGMDGMFQASMFFAADSFDGVVYAYGVRDNSEAARVLFGNLTVTSAQTVASLIVSRSLTEADVTLTETRAALITPSNP